MGVLDDAIREHLELRRKHGASDEELARQEQEALTPARREVLEAAEPEDVEHPPLGEGPFEDEHETVVAGPAGGPRSGGYEEDDLPPLAHEEHLDEHPPAELGGNRGHASDLDDPVAFDELPADARPGPGDEDELLLEHEPDSVAPEPLTPGERAILEEEDAHEEEEELLYEEESLEDDGTLMPHGDEPLGGDGVISVEPTEVFEPVAPDDEATPLEGGLIEDELPPREEDDPAERAWSEPEEAEIVAAEEALAEEELLAEEDERPFEPELLAEEDEEPSALGLPAEEEPALDPERRAMEGPMEPELLDEEEEATPPLVEETDDVGPAERRARHEVPDFEDGTPPGGSPRRDLDFDE